MNILLVDDNQYVLDGLLDGIDFQSLGISRVFTALNVRKAKEQMQEQSIEVVITDIEMLNGSGLDLLAWINENYPQTVTLFCTSFADFNYAQEAVRLKCFDYYVKPIRYQEFEEHVKNAIQEVHKREQSRKVQEYGQYWMDNQWSLKQSFWYRYLYSLEDYIAEELQEEIEEQKLGYRVEQPVSICVIKMGDDERLQTIRSVDKNFIFKNISMEIFQKEHYEPEAILLTANHTMTVILTKLAQQQDLRKVCVELVESLNRYVSRANNCYYRENISILEAPKALEEMEEISLDDISDKGSVISYDLYVKSRRDADTADTKGWEQLLQDGEKKILLEEINQYLICQLNNRSLTRQRMREVRAMLVQISSSVLQKNAIEAYSLFNSERYSELFEDAVRSISYMNKFAEYVVEAVMKCKQEQEASQDTVMKVIRYIEQNYTKTITKDELESISYMNINYLSRQFKARTGKSLHNYLVNYRLDKAVEFLREGKYSISDIAMMVGYDNFSYFSRLFKEKKGCSPKEYK